jgi:hypothetical protein
VAPHYCQVARSDYDDSDDASFSIEHRDLSVALRSLLEKFAAIQMLDVHFPTSDGRELDFSRYTQPEKDHQMLLGQQGWELPPQSPPRITQKGQLLPE